MLPFIFSLNSRLLCYVHESIIYKDNTPCAFFLRQNGSTDWLSQHDIKNLHHDFLFYLKVPYKHAYVPCRLCLLSLLCQAVLVEDPVQKTLGSMSLSSSSAPQNVLSKQVPLLFPLKPLCSIWLGQMRVVRSFPNGYLVVDPLHANSGYFMLENRMF